MVGNKFFGVSKKAEVSLLTGLISCWELDETSGTTVTDANGLHNGTSYNITVNQTGNIDKAYLFDATSDRIEVNDHNDFSFTNGSNDLPFSFSAWIKLNIIGTQSSYIISKVGADISSPLGEYVFHYNSSGEIWVRCFTGATLTDYIGKKVADADSGMTADEWHNVVATYDGSENASGFKIYVDGVLPSQTTVTSGSYTGMVNLASKVYLGNIDQDHSVYLHGLLDQTAIWKNRELTQTEVTALYNGGSGLAYTSWT